MFFFNPTKIALIVVAVIAFSGTVAGGFHYVSGLRADLAISQENTRKLEGAISEQKEAIARIQQEQLQIRAIHQQLNQEVKTREKDVTNLRDRFDRDITYVS